MSSSRRRQTPWIQRNARWLIGAIATAGALNTAYLVISKLTQKSAACPTEGCEKVLSSAYATVFGQPLALFGLLAYVGMALMAVVPMLLRSGDKGEKKERSGKSGDAIENLTWLGLFAGATAMTIFSGYLMNVMVSQFVVPYGWGGVCYYCIASALFALAMFVLTLIGRAWDDIGQLLFTGLLVGMVTLIGTVGVYSSINTPRPIADESVPGQAVPPITTASGPAEMQLAKYLTSVGAKMYGAYWCSHCWEQKQLFGKEATDFIPYTECAPDGKRSRTEECKAAGIKGFPTWDVKGQKLEGTQTLDKLAELSGYNGPKDFKNK